MTAPAAPLSPRTIYRCCDDRRREAVRAHGTLNGIDFVEVNDGPGVASPDRQRSLFVHFVKPLAPGALGAANVRIDGGERIPRIGVTSATIGTGAAAGVLSIGVEEPGDFSTYTLSLVAGANSLTPPVGFDPVLSSVDFSFKVACPSDLDCAPSGTCLPIPLEQPELDYLSKDYNSFRRLLLDRLSVLAPQWAERNPADLGIALVELLAYVGDQLSYQQDAVATEAYLGTARRRISARRHARLVDYQMHDGCNARAWVQVRLAADNVTVAPGTQLLSRLDGVATRIAPGSGEHARALALGPTVFETMGPAVTCFLAHQEMHFYAWGATDCCLAVGSTRATLRDHLPNLQVGDVVVFEEVMGPETGQAGDADPAHRHAVRLTSVSLSSDPAGGRFPDPVTGTDEAVAVTEIAWSADDALPFSLCISATVGTTELPAVSVARGNIVLADHGLTVAGEALGTVPESTLFRAPPPAPDRCSSADAVPLPPRFNPRFARAPLTQAAPYDPAQLPESAAAVMRWQVGDAVAAVAELVGTSGTQTDDWTPRRDLLASGPGATDVVIEVDDGGVAAVRFGDTRNGARPPAGTSFVATYRVGNGAAGNLGAEALCHIVSSDAGIVGVRNPLAATGGQEPESIVDVRQRAPAAFRTQERAVTVQDYASVAERHSGVQRAAASLRWTGSWRTVFVSVDRLCGAAVDQPFRDDMLAFLEPYRMAGYDLEADIPRYVSVELELQVCVLRDYLRANVKAALADAFSNRVLPDGRRGLFHPDNWTFNQPLYVSQLYATAQAVPGVASVAVATLQRQGTDSTQAISDGFLHIDRLEIVRLDNDPSFPEHGILRLKLDGGR